MCEIWFGWLNDHGIIQPVGYIAGQVNVGFVTTQARGGLSNIAFNSNTVWLTIPVYNNNPLQLVHHS